MKLNPVALIITLVFVAVLSVGLIGQGNLTGQAAGNPIQVNSGTILSVIAAMLAIGVLVVAGLQQSKK